MLSLRSVSLIGANSLRCLDVVVMKVEVFPYLLHFKSPAGTSRGVYTERQVWYVKISSEGSLESGLKDSPDGGPYGGLGSCLEGSPESRVGWGECAPLPDLSCDAGPDYEKILRSFCARLEAEGTIDYEAMRPYPSMLFGLETALQHYHAGSLELWPSQFTKGQAGIPINGLIWMGDRETMHSRIEAKMAAGFRCIKLKIGAINFDDELALLKLIRSHFTSSEVELRVDANGAFAPSEASAKLSVLASLGLHSIEQPIRAGQWDKMAELCASTPLPIALDEELIGVNRLSDKALLLDTIKPQYIILKPSLHGGIKGATEWINLARERGIGWWITSALESNVGLNAIAQWTAHLYESLEPCGSDEGSKMAGSYQNMLPQGLGTGLLFTDNIDYPLAIRRDCLWYNNESSQI